MKKTISILTAIMLTLIIFSSCNELKKMVKKADEVNYRTNPSPLEMHANKVAINVSVAFPPKYFGKKVKLVIIPTLVADDGTKEFEFPTQTIQGEKFQDSYQTISYVQGGSFSFQDTIDYDPAFRMSDLNLKFQLSDQKRHSANLVAVKIADGIITTPELVEKGIALDNGFKDGNTLGQPVIVPISKPTVSFNNKMAKIYFDLQKANVKKGEIKKAEVKDLMEYIKSTVTDPNQEITKFVVKSYASPDGPQDLNQNLVNDRGTNVQSAFTKQLAKEKLQGVDLNNLITKATTPAEDWAGFKELVEKSNIADKHLILKVLSMYSSDEKREAEIKNMAKVYDELRKDILPLLRRSILQVEYKGREKQDAEIINLGYSNPSALSKQELLYAGYKSTDPAKQEEIYKNYLKNNPSDWKAWNNLAAVQAQNGNLSQAKINFEKVINLNNNNAAALNNLGAIAMGEKDWDKAWDYFVKAEDAGCKSDALAYNMGAIMIMRGLYSEATTKFKGNSFNKALAQTLNDENDAAMGTLNAMSNSNAIFYYLKAVTAARAENDGDVFENLRIAVSKDASLKEYATNDLEFENYFDVKEFKNIIK